MTQNNLAIAYSDRIKGERGENIEKAIAFFEAALEVITRPAFPQFWAMTQNNLAAAYKNRIQGEREENIEKAIAFYQAALEIYTRPAFGQDWAMIQNNLANAYRNRIKGERGENIEKAIAFYEAALEIYTRPAFGQDWAMTQNNLANAYKDRIKGERGENIEKAIAFYQAALQVYTRDAFPQQWAMTQNNLAAAYSERIEGERGEDLGEFKIIVAQLGDVDAEALKTAAERLQQKLGNAAVVLASIPEPDKVSLVAAFSPEVNKKGLQAGKFIGELLKFAAEKAAGGRIWRKLGDAMQVSCRKRWKLLAICCLKGWVNYSD
jgi:tetratricopeptide (TPR) repeat protein